MVAVHIPVAPNRGSVRPTKPRKPGSASFDKWVREMTEATQERQELERSRLYTKPQIEAKLSRSSRRILKREADAEMARRAKSARSWRAALLRLPVPLRFRCASLIWWDLFSSRPYKERVTEFDDLLGFRQQDFSIPAAEIAQGLHACGYSPWRATVRAFSDVAEDE